MRSDNPELRKKANAHNPLISSSSQSLTLFNVSQAIKAVGELCNGGGPEVDGSKVMSAEALYGIDCILECCAVALQYEQGEIGV